MKGLGYQTLVEFYGCDTAIINDTQLMEQLLLKSAELAGLTVVEVIVHHFSPIGVSGVVVVKESHISVHTWPEYGYVALDFFTCNSAYSLTEAIHYLTNELKATSIEKKTLIRGEQINDNKRKNIQLD